MVIALLCVLTGALLLKIHTSYWKAKCTKASMEVLTAKFISGGISEEEYVEEKNALRDSLNCLSRFMLERGCFDV